MATTPYGNTCAWDTSPNAPSPIFLLSSTSSRRSLTTPCSRALEPGEGWEGGPGGTERQAKDGRICVRGDRKAGGVWCRCSLSGTPLRMGTWLGTGSCYRSASQMTWVSTTRQGFTGRVAERWSDRRHTVGRLMAWHLELVLLVSTPEELDDQEPWFRRREALLFSRWIVYVPTPPLAAW